MSVRAGGAEEMFLDVKELAVLSCASGKPMLRAASIFIPRRSSRSSRWKLMATAELLESQIRIEGNLETKIELVCARCLEPVWKR